MVDLPQAGGPLITIRHGTAPRPKAAARYGLPMSQPKTPAPADSIGVLSSNRT
jgi:hypothetical protein